MFIGVPFTSGGSFTLGGGDYDSGRPWEPRLEAHDGGGVVGVLLGVREAGPPVLGALEPDPFGPQSPGVNVGARFALGCL